MRYGLPALTLVVAGAAVLGYLFFAYIPWLTAHPIAEISMCDAPAPAPPEWARAFSVNHGRFTYYRQSTRDKPAKEFAIIGGMFVSWLVTASGGLYLISARERPKKARATDEE